MIIVHLFQKKHTYNFKNFGLMHFEFTVMNGVRILICSILVDIL